MLFDDVITTHVGHGKGQAFMLLSSSCSWSTLAMIVLNMVFVTQTPDWQCVDANDQQCMAARQSSPSAGFCDLSPEQYIWLNPHSSLVSSFGLICNQSWKVGFVNAMFFFGYWVGSSIFGWVADKYGRKRCLLLSNAASAATAFMCACSSSYGWYVVWRTALGCCCPGLPVASYVLSTEAVGPACRGRAGMYSQLVYHVGEWLLPLLAFWLQDWRMLNAAIACVCIITGALVLPLPESPRWLLLQGRREEAEQTLSWLANLNGRQLPVGLQVTHAISVVLPDTTGSTAAPARKAAELSQLEFSGAKERGERASSGTGDDPGAVEFLPELVAAPSSSFVLDSEDHDDAPCSYDCTALLGVANNSDACKGRVTDEPSCQLQQGPSQQHSEGLWLLFSHALLARYFVLTSLLCLVMAVGFYTVSLATQTLKGSLYMNFFLTSVGEVPAALIFALAVDSIGRRVTVGAGLLMTGLACCACTLTPAGWATTATASVGKAACGGTWTVSYVYAAEVFPTSIRSAALAGTNQASRLGGIIAPGILYFSEQLGLAAATPFAVIGALALMTAATLAWLPETLGQPQPDTVADLDRLYGGSSSCGDGTHSKPLEHAPVWNWLKARLLNVVSDGVVQGSELSATQAAVLEKQGSKLKQLLSGVSSGRLGSWSSDAAGRPAPSSSADGNSWKQLQADELLTEPDSRLLQNSSSLDQQQGDMEMGSVS